jgi:hypothetical protein
MTPGRKFSTSTSADFTSRRSNDLPSGVFKLTVMDFLPPFWARNDAPMCRAFRSGSLPSCRARSPPPGASTFTTSAPSSAS